MEKIDQSIIFEAEKFVENLLQDHLDNGFYYHDFKHALAVKNYTETIGNACNLDEKKLDLLRVSALFHDTGFIKSVENHVEDSIEIASRFLKTHQIEQASIDKIGEIILATKMPQNPKDLVAQVLCDADLMYIAEDNCYEHMEAMYEESLISHSEFSNRNLFDLETIRFFSNHTYFTEYGQEVLQSKKMIAKDLILERMKRREARKSKKGLYVNGEKKITNYSRGVETLFRLTARNQINLNSIADNKSNILISVSAIIISIIITMLVGDINSMSDNFYPVVTLLVVCLVTIILAILSTRPNVKWGHFTKEDIIAKKVDLIFFGNFINMDYDDYLNAVMSMMENDEQLYSTMIKNQYSLGKILAKKFRLVKLAYNVFMIGITVTVVSFLVNILYF
jgi:predicted metal-dependent HD superfamily phosphohydrolase